MGVTGITVHWKLTDNETNTEFWQCFYLDAEEFGFDSYESVTGPDTEETERKAMALADRLMGGLGGIPVEITERETRGLIQDYILLNRKKGIPIPEDAEVDFIMRPEVILTLDERKQLMDKQCEEITGEYQLVNYFIMIPFYVNVMNMPLDVILSMIAKVIPGVDTLPKLILMATSPFNLLKGVVLAAVTFLLYKRLSPLLKSA